MNLHCRKAQMELFLYFYCKHEHLLPFKNEKYHRRWRQHRAITVETVNTVDTVDPVDPVDTGDTVDTVETVLQC